LRRKIYVLFEFVNEEEYGHNDRYLGYFPLIVFFAGNT
jgi:hypothetical protein